VSAPATRSGKRSTAARDALAQLRGLVNNADLAQCIPVELRRAGFGRVSFLCFAHAMWVLGSGRTPPADGPAETLLEPGRNGPAQDGATPVYVWQTAVGLLRTDESDQGTDLVSGDGDVLAVFAEGVGAILERNIALERVEAMRVSAQAHSAAILSLTTFIND
jgi:hypothetical protein